jgi:hypothetical protein
MYKSRIRPFDGGSVAPVRPNVAAAASPCLSSRQPGRILRDAKIAGGINTATAPFFERYRDAGVPCPARQSPREDRIFLRGFSIAARATPP